MISLYSPQNEQIDTIETTTTITFDSRSSFCHRISRMSPQSRRFRRREAAKTSMTNALDKMCGQKLLCLSLCLDTDIITRCDDETRVSRIGDYAFLENRTSDEDDDECIISLARACVLCVVSALRRCAVKKEDI
jgi:hypothetical protein